MKTTIEIKRFVLYVTVLLIVVVSKVVAVNPPDTIPFSDSWVQTDWTETNSFFNLSSSQDRVFARIWDSFGGGRMFLAANDGTSWTPIASADSSIDILSIIMLESGMLAGTWNGFYQSTDEGTTWNAFTPTGIPAGVPIWSVEKVDATLYAGLTGAIYASTDNGNTWTVLGSGITAGARITSLVASGDDLYAGSASNGVFKWTNGGTSWTAINTNLKDTHIMQLVALDNQLVALTLTGVYLSGNGGTNWAADTSGLEKVNCMVTVNDRVITGTDGNGTFLLDEDGVTWNTFNMGMPDDARIWSLAINKDGIYAGTNSGIWFLNSANTVNGVKEIAVPSTFNLEQNYPNPFKTSTTISFYVPSTSYVSLKIYDIQGKEVATLIAEEMAPGYYSRNWDAAGISSGIYIYRLQAGARSVAKRLIIMR